MESQIMASRESRPMGRSLAPSRKPAAPKRPEPEQLDLFQLAERINTEHAAAVAAVGKAAGHALTIGKYLLQAQTKVQLEGLGWIKWVEDNLTFGPRQAQKYIKVLLDANHGSHSTDLEGKSLRAARAALAAVAPPEPRAKAERDQDDDEEEDAAPREVDVERLVGKVSNVIFEALNAWPKDQMAQLPELVSELRGFIEMIEKRIK
jgi:hypothetical protein